MNGGKKMQNRKNFQIWIVLLCFLICNYPFLAAQTEQVPAQSKKWNISFSADYLWPGNNKSNLTPTADICPIMDAGLGQPNSSCSNSVQPAGAAGLRVSFFRDYKGIELGPSIGYLSGGPGTGNENILVSSSPTGNMYSKLNISETADTMRFLMEARKTWPLFSGVFARVGGGIGMAVENKNVTSSDWNTSGTKFGIPHYSSLGWLTWEFSPALIYKDIALGVRYVGFGRGGRTPWHTYGAFLGVDLN